MRLSRQMIEIFARVARGNNTLESLAKAQNKSVNWISEIVQELEKEGFIIKNKSFKLKASRIAVEVSNTNHATKLKELIFKYPTINFEEILSDSKLLFLASLSEDWIDIEALTNLSQISKYMIDRYRPMMKNKGIIIQKNGLYKINETAWPKLQEFLIAYKNYSQTTGVVKWKYQNEIIFEVDRDNLVSGPITGFAKYNLKINSISVLCRVPEKKLGRQEIFIHSLFEINDPRTLNLALTFYLKNKLDYKQVLPIAMKYGKYTMFENMISILKSKQEKIKLEKLPDFERADFRRTARMYGVKNV
jgi:hypothetical protein